MRTILIEDEPHILRMMERFIQAEPNLKWLGSFHDPVQALEFLTTQEVDLVFLDVEMPKMNGIDLAKRLPETTQVVFTTAHSQYAVEAFGLQATHYLLKPITEEMIHDLVPLVSKRYTETLQPKHHRTCTIQCFNNFSVKTHEGDLVKWPTQKTEELFAYLIYHRDKVVNKWLIAEMLYPDIDDPQRALHNVYNLIYRLKKTLADFDLNITVQTINNGYSLHLDDVCSCDYHDWLNTGQTEANTRLFVDKDYKWH
ncbi:response regulator [Exiguobacterium sp. SH3S1]|uniref:response regulator n=1 Tax=Exiguobacterium sp. SH3S1 TaxID=2510955 RepID=UPI00103AA6D5|nr:response regulator [Exiguobacterium sp. SH3S1]TCI60753.1 response regulator [Exiguobacterium sp. SH3S1]